MIKFFKVGPHHRWIVVMGLLASITLVAWPWTVHANQEGWKIRIRAQNRSTTDTPFCGIGGGLVGDSLAVDAFTDLSGVTTGVATFKSATGSPITFKIDRVFSFCCGGIALSESSTNNVVAIWLDNLSAPIHVDVELPGGCENASSNFTAGVDNLSLRMSSVTDE